MTLVITSNAILSRILNMAGSNDFEHVSPEVMKQLQALHRIDEWKKAHDAQAGSVGFAFKQSADSLIEGGERLD